MDASQGQRKRNGYLYIVGRIICCAPNLQGRHISLGLEWTAVFLSGPYLHHYSGLPDTTAINPALRFGSSHLIVILHGPGMPVLESVAEELIVICANLSEQIERH